MIDPEVMRRLEQQASLIRQLQGALGGLRVIRGSVTGGGSVTEGEGFTVAANGTGDYTLTWGTPFSDAPVVVVGPGPAAFVQGVKLFNGVSPSTTSARVFSFTTTSGVATSGPFHFIAIGPA